MRPGPRAREALAALAIVAAGAIAFLPAFSAGFVFDDHALIENGRLLRGPLSAIWLGGHAPDYWPLTVTSFWIDWRVFGANPAGWHAVNVALHLLTALLLWRALDRLGVGGAWLGGLIFAVHPVTVESVAWISERKNTLSAVFWLAAILVWLRFDELRTARDRVLALTLFALALLSKASTVPLPVVLLGIAAAKRRKIARRDLTDTAPFFALALLAGAVNVWFQHRNAMAGGGASARGLAERVGGAGWALASYVETAFVPVRLALARAPWIAPDSPSFWIMPAAVVAGFALLFRLRRRAWGRAALLALGYQAVCTGPVLGLVDMAFLRVAPASNHLQYLALMGPAAFAAWAWSRVSARAPAPGIAAGAAVALALAAATFHRASAFHDDFSLWQAAARDAPDSPFARAAFGEQLLGRGRFPEAQAEFESAIASSRDQAFRHSIAATLRTIEGRPDEAAAEARLVLASNPAPGLASDAAATLLDTGHADEAIAVLRDLVRRAPDASEYVYALGAALSRAGRPGEAAAVLLAYCERNPGHPRMEPALALVLLRLGRADEARAHAAAVLGVDPADPRAESQVRAWAAEAAGGADR